MAIELPHQETSNSRNLILRKLEEILEKREFSCHHILDNLEQYSIRLGNIKILLKGVDIETRRLVFHYEVLEIAKDYGPSIYLNTPFEYGISFQDDDWETIG
jgi:hypothetical protein